MMFITAPRDIGPSRDIYHVAVIFIMATVIFPMAPRVLHHGPVSRYRSPAAIRLPILSRRRCFIAVPVTFIMVLLLQAELQKQRSKTKALQAKLRCESKTLQAKLFKQNPKK